MTLEIKRRYNFDEWELIAEYDGEEFTGDADFIDSFAWLEGEGEDRILEEIDGPNLLAMAVEGREESEEGPAEGERPLSDEIAERAAKRLSEKDGVSSSTAGVGQATYGGAGDDDEDEEEVEKASFGEMDDEFMKFYRDVVWWKVDEDDPDLSKAPDMWRGDQNVPEFVAEHIREALRDNAFWQGQFEGLPQGAWQRMQNVFQESMTQPQGWSLSSLVDNITEEFAGLGKQKALEWARNETAALANKAREEAYEARPESDEYEFYWTGPADHRETPVCQYLKEQTHPQFGGTPVKGMDALRELFEEAVSAQDNPHLDEDFPGATPERFDEYVPHYQCRHTFVREVYL